MLMLFVTTPWGPITAHAKMDFMETECTAPVSIKTYLRLGFLTHNHNNKHKNKQQVRTPKRTSITITKVFCSSLADVLLLLQ